MSVTHHSSEAFARYIEKKVREDKLSYMDAILDFCDKKRVEPELIAPFISTKMKTALAIEGQNLHLLKARKSLPLDD